MHLTQIHAARAYDARLDTNFNSNEMVSFSVNSCYSESFFQHAACVMEIIINQLLLIDLSAVDAANWLPPTGGGEGP